MEAEVQVLADEEPRRVEEVEVVDVNIERVLEEAPEDLRVPLLRSDAAALFPEVLAMRER